MPGMKYQQNLILVGYLEQNAVQAGFTVYYNMHC